MLLHYAAVHRLKSAGTDVLSSSSSLLLGLLLGLIFSRYKRLIRINPKHFIVAVVVVVGLLVGFTMLRTSLLRLFSWWRWELRRRRIGGSFGGGRLNLFRRKSK